MNGTVKVSGIAQVSWTVVLPTEHQHEGVVCKDPAVETVLEAIQDSCDISLWGHSKPDIHVELDLDEVDIEIIEDDR